MAADVVSSHPESSEEFQQFFGVRSMTFNVIIFIYHHKAQKTGHFSRLVILFCLNFHNRYLKALLVGDLCHLQAFGDASRDYMSTSYGSNVL
ncbi:hypothetical protein A6S26_16790 [Nostoc sp. ATCC 43529]|nr:hypothetical protein A6S26_16790 [Nostoc sp. ATCC 43529]